jgi:hypothetical protein
MEACCAGAPPQPGAPPRPCDGSTQVNPFEYLLALLRHPEAVLEEPCAWMPWSYLTLRQLQDHVLDPIDVYLPRHVVDHIFAATGSD